MESDFFDRFINQLQVRYPESTHRCDYPRDFRTILSPLLFCPQTVSLPTRLKEEAMTVVRAFSALRKLTVRAQTLREIPPSIPDPGNTSVLMSYDFHVDEAGHLRLIEINTNASMSLMVEVLHQVHGVTNPFSADFSDEIIECFRMEFKRAKPKGSTDLKTVVITDETPAAQRLYAEFIAYQELFQRSGLDTTIVDAKDLVFHNGRLRQPDGRAIDLVYNRHTDFYFEASATIGLREAMLKQAVCITPHPHEYRLLADKERLVELARPGAIAALPIDESLRQMISQTLIRTFSVAEHADPDSLWAERKKLFFKPMRSFGGKAAYRGASLSRRIFEEILKGQYLAQEFVPAPTIKLTDSANPDTEFKYDLRFYVYDDRIQQVCARLYQGQMTNSQTPGGGITVVNWV
jgi:hypothetical protein